MFRSFEDLEVWQHACAFWVRVYRELEDCRDFGLRDQMRGSAVSIASNIAEGSERGGKDYARFLFIARGSAAELRTQAYITAQVGILPDAAMRSIVEATRRINRMLFGLPNHSQSKAPHTEHRKPKHPVGRVPDRVF